MIVNVGLRRFKLGGRANVVASFVADYITNGGIGPTRGTAPSFTRATTATITDQDLVVRNVLSGEVRFGGFRRVQNLLIQTENFAHASWTKINGGAGSVPTVTSGFTAPDGSSSAWRLQANSGGTAGADFSVLRQSLSIGAISNGQRTAWIKSNTGVNQQMYFSVPLGTASITATTSWQRFSFLTATANANFDFGAYPSGAGNTATNVDVLIWHPQTEDATGQTNQNPAEYVSVGVLSAPYHGANVDGVKYFSTLNGNTVASNVVTEATGAAISSSILGGLLIEPAATDLLTARADARDMTTANWTLGATMTRARTSVGADGVANKATRLTGGATAATNTISQTLVLAAATRTYSVLIKRVTGTGAINITQDGLGTSINVASLINSSTYTLVQISGSTLNPSFGIQIATNGDAIDADWNQYQTGNLVGLVNSRIPEAISTRNADVLTYATTGWLNAAAGTLYSEFYTANNAASMSSASLNDASGNQDISNLQTTTTIAYTSGVNGGVTQWQLTGAVLIANTVGKICQVYQANDFAAWANNVSLGTDAVGTVPTVTRLQIGISNTIFPAGHYIRKVAYYPTRLSNAAAQSLTA